VLNRPQKREADPGVPSRGVLPLLGVEHGAGWQDHLRVDGMASFLLVLAAPDRLTTWDFDGAAVTTTEHPPGTWMVTSGGPEDRKAERWLPLFAEASFPDGWAALLREEPPQDDPAALTVRHEQDGLVYATVFGELLDTEPGRLHLASSRSPWSGDGWRALDG
jgi:hypothetical protein